MKKGLVNIAQGSPELLNKLHIFLREQKEKYPEKKLKTLASAIDFAIEQASRVPELEGRIQDLEEKEVKIND